jgi:hypothetical protein
VILGFTGSRHEPTGAQRVWLVDYILGNGKISEFHHGCCVGSDEFSHRAAKNSTDLTVAEIVLHPPFDTTYEMEYTDWDYANCVWYPRKEFLRRNRDIVNASDRMVALPNGPEKMNGSGTWYTVRFAVEQGKQVTICDPTGKLEVR